MRAALSFCLLLLTSAIQAPADDLPQQGFNEMYNLSFAGAHQDFQHWEKLNPDNPEAPVFDAAAYLFSEFDRLKILQAEFFVNDHSYTERKREMPNEDIKRKFEQALEQSKKLSDLCLQKNPNDPNALFANVLRLGLHSDYLALIDKRNLSALGEIKEATKTAEDLLRLDPHRYDAYIAVGIENYLLSLKPAPVRWLLNATGAQSDRQMGIEKLQLTASKGQYLAPYAQLLLAVAALRDKNTGQARHLLADLANRFPRNPLYREELNQIH